MAAGQGRNIRGVSKSAGRWAHPRENSIDGSKSPGVELTRLIALNLFVTGPI